MEIISSGKRYGLGNPEIETQQEIIFSSDGCERGTSVREVLEVLLTQARLSSRTSGKNIMATLHLQMALENLED